MKPLRSVIIPVRFTVEEDKVLKDLADKSGDKNKSDILREPIIKELNRRKRNKKGAIAS
jgi:hypothetical protein